MRSPPTPRLVIASSAAERLASAQRWLAQQRPDARVCIVGATQGAAARCARLARLPTVGWQRTTVPLLARELAGPVLLREGRVVASDRTRSALWMRVVHRLRETGLLARLEPVGAFPGLAGCFARTVDELRRACCAADSLEAPLPEACAAYQAALDELGLADEVFCLDLACRALEEDPSTWGERATLLLDVPIHGPLEERLLAALAGSSRELFATCPTGDERTARALRRLPRVEQVAVGAGASDPLSSLRGRLFDDSGPAGPALEGGEVEILSAATEAEECVAIARRVLAAARSGARFDEMAVLVRALPVYAHHLAEAFRRAGVPVDFAAAPAAPSRSGRALLCLLACAEAGLSAERFLSYLSLNEVPPPPGEASGRAVHRWSRWIVDAGVYQGLDRWRRRLDLLTANTRDELAAAGADASQVQRLRSRLEQQEDLKAFAVPLVEQLAALPERAPWGAWLGHLAQLARCGLRHPELVLRALDELSPLEPVGPVDLGQVRAVLEPWLSNVDPSPGARPEAGGVFIGTVAAARGRSFRLVFVPGLSECLFPTRSSPDPLLPDETRRAVSPHLATEASHADDERLALRLVVGAAREKLILSYARLEAARARPRIPSVYLLEAASAARGSPVTSDALRAAAELEAGHRIGWSAPLDPEQAVDDAEWDLCVIARLSELARPDRGAARYLLTSNPHLARALRLRARRWRHRWTPADGLVGPSATALEVLAAHRPAARPFSPTALQHYAACPYRFFLSAVLRLETPVPAEPSDALDPLQRGELMHRVQFELLSELAREQLLPTARTLPSCQARLVEHLRRAAEQVLEQLSVRIRQLWELDLAVMGADLGAWLSRLAGTSDAWVPRHFELAFGLPGRVQKDAASVAEPVALSCGLRLRGAIDLVERSATGGLRATDYKSGRARAVSGLVVGGGRHLQPLLYALALEQLFPQSPILPSRLYYCTHAGAFREVEVALDERGRAAMARFVELVDDAIGSGFLPAAPLPDECNFCDFQVVCGPDAAQRAGVKPVHPADGLAELRSMP